MRNFINNFLRGLLLIVPMAAAIYVVYYLYNFLDNLIPIAKNIPGLSFFLVIILITIAGSYAKRYNTGLVNWFENFIKDIPLLNLIYSSIKDLMTSFVGEKKKFNNSYNYIRIFYDFFVLIILLFGFLLNGFIYKKNKILKLKSSITLHL